jgi:hypothetical protein
LYRAIERVRLPPIVEDHVPLEVIKRQLLKKASSSL